jgi:hypothetical protein
MVGETYQSLRRYRDDICALRACSRRSLNETDRIPICMIRSDHRSGAFGVAPARSLPSPRDFVDMMSKRVGKWAWALSGEERIAAAAVGVAQSEKSAISAKLKRKYDAMLEKQRKLTAGS